MLEQTRHCSGPAITLCAAHLRLTHRATGLITRGQTTGYDPATGAHAYAGDCHTMPRHAPSTFAQLTINLQSRIPYTLTYTRARLGHGALSPLRARARLYAPSSAITCAATLRAAAELMSSARCSESRCGRLISRLLPLATASPLCASAPPRTCRRDGGASSRAHSIRLPPRSGRRLRPLHPAAHR